MSNTLVNYDTGELIDELRERGYNTVSMAHAGPDKIHVVLDRHEFSLVVDAARWCLIYHGYHDDDPTHLEVAKYENMLKNND